MLKIKDKNILSTILLLLLITATTTTMAQQFGGNPPSIKWKQVNTPAAKVVFPAGLDSAGLRVADIVQQMNHAIQPTIGYKQRQISILLQNQTIISNAYVGLAPFRSEFYLTPGQNSFEIGSLPWTDQLAIHEFRHVQQYNNFNVGLSKALRVLFGEGGQAFGNGIAIPNWFFEGDAVFNETHVSQQGRGRLPYFFNGYRALWDAGKDYSWMKLRNGSYRDYIPDWYPMGYMMVAYGREKYGDDFWKKVTHDAAAFNGLFYPLQKAIRKYSGESFAQFRNDGFNYFKDQYTADSLNHSSTQSLINKTQHFIASREYPAYVNDSTLIYMKSTYEYLPQFVLNTNGHEKKVGVRSVSIDNYFDYHNGKVVYATYHPDKRWSYRDYSELQVLDINTGEEHRLTKHTKYFSPAFNNDATQVVAVQVSPTGKNMLHILSANDGKVLSIVPNSTNLFYTYPKFYGNAQLVSAVRNTDGKMSLAIIDIKTGKARYLLPFSYQPISFPAVHGDTIYFSATAGINDRLFAVVAGTGKLLGLQQLPGAINKYQPAITHNKLAWVEFTAYGYKLQQANNSAANWTILPGNKMGGGLPDFKISALKRDSSTGLLATITDKPLPVTNYNKGYHLFNFHSLIPNFNDPNYKFSLVGENVLNTFQSELSFNYNRNEGYKQFGFNAVYGALFPYISGGVDYILDRRGYYKGSNIYWNESDIHAGLQLPLNFSSGKQFTGLSIGSDIYYKQSTFQQAYRSLFNDRNYTYLNNYVTFSNHIQQAKKNIYPRLGETISLNYKTAITGTNANQFLASGTFYLPGILVNHNLVINAAHQQKGADNVVDFSNNFPFSRGYTAQNLHNMNKVGVNYHFPIIYPDAGVANTIYFLRIRGNMFYDYTHATDFYTNGTVFKGDFRSTGGEVFFDTKWFNQQQLTFGIRYSRLLDNDLFGGTGRNRIELVLPVTFF
ncbi:hypothetical protein [Mucilaginibacter sp.]|uniref:TolB family protein n=1 Tax=Mucilaginibacter sp. TaxID=1882438 RepID=UPI002603138D|nr:hypothetical protein [Mucilaginibacter sp.]